MALPDSFVAPGADCVAVGVGRLTLDVIVRGDEAARSQAGGTCGNVMADLAYLGWQAYPLTDLGDEPLEGPSLLIETRGGDGLRYLDRRHGPGPWRHLPALPVAVVRDAGGSGDWATAGLIHLAGRRGAAGFQALSAEDLHEALQ